MAADDPAQSPKGTADPDVEARLREQLEFYFSPENLPHDPFLVDRLDAKMQVPLSVIAGFSRIRQLCGTGEGSEELLLRAVRSSPKLVLSEGSTVSVGAAALRPPQRLTVVLRDVPHGATEEDVRAAFCDAPVPEMITPDIASTWFIRFATERDAQAALLSLIGKQVGGEPARGRIKSENANPAALLAQYAALAQPQSPSGLRGKGKGRGGKGAKGGKSGKGPYGGWGDISWMMQAGMPMWEAPRPGKGGRGKGDSGRGGSSRPAVPLPPPQQGPGHASEFPVAAATRGGYGEPGSVTRWSVQELQQRFAALAGGGPAELRAAAESLAWPLPTSADCVCIREEPLLELALNAGGCPKITADDVVAKQPEPQQQQQQRGAKGAKGRRGKGAPRQTHRDPQEPTAAVDTGGAFEPPSADQAGEAWAAVAGLGPQSPADAS